MSVWKARVFWKAVTVEQTKDGYCVKLDGRQVKTPGKVPLILPTEALAQAVAEEWRAQEGVVRPEAMPMTRMANSALEKVTQQFDEVVAHLASYGETDLLCHRAESPAGLVARQTAGWDPILHWAAQDMTVLLTPTAGIIATSQPKDSLAKLKRAMAEMTPFHLTAFHDLVAIPGSIILAFGVARKRLSPDDAFDLSRIDETWQVEFWGQDEDAAKFEAAKRAAMRDAARFFTLCS